VKSVPSVVEKAENILDKKAPDTHFGQCLQRFRVTKKFPTMGCTISALCAKLLQ
jgi:hypothetical protein